MGWFARSPSLSMTPSRPFAAPPASVEWAQLSDSRRRVFFGTPTFPVPRACISPLSSSTPSLLSLEQPPGSPFDPSLYLSSSAPTTYPSHLTAPSMRMNHCRSDDRADTDCPREGKRDGRGIRGEYRRDFGHFLPI
ncbi:hypothetical protein D9757_014221 [Collybiopsis confluens]|uniref:Uncharacterized protein n=1 Tax=Collybiopsis confluens TaxID=2823264 RepID=A0A8H5CWM5_9AGAR|nr:hypothetical protein D9757_014221 [Collybiopsis confluens]